MMRIYECVFVVCLFWIPNVSTEDKIADACHGSSAFPQAHNLLECDEGTQICITEVRYYRWDPFDPVCPRRLSAPVPDRCCRRNTSRCSWVTDDHQELQRNCTGQSRCDLHSSSEKIVAEPCVRIGDTSTVSSVRSITYTCISSSTCPPPTNVSSVTTPITATSSGQTSAENQVNIPEESTASTSPIDITPVIVGSVVAFIAVVGIIIITVVFVRKRFKKPNTKEVAGIAGSGSVPDMTPRQESSHSYYNISMRNPDQQNQPNTRGGADNSVGNQGVPIAAPPNLDNQNYYNVEDETDSPTYYNTTPEEDHAYTELVENPYNKLTYTDNSQESNYTTLS